MQRAASGSMTWPLPVWRPHDRVAKAYGVVDKGFPNSRRRRNEDTSMGCGSWPSSPLMLLAPLSALPVEPPTAQ